MTNDEDFPFFPGTYRARCTRVVDGDTADFEVDVGFHLRYVGRFRLLGIDTPELNAKDPAERQRAQEAWDFLTDILDPGAPGWPIKLTDVERDPDAFGRYLAKVWFHGVDEGGRPVVFEAGACLLALAMAKRYVK